VLGAGLLRWHEPRADGARLACRRRTALRALRPSLSRQSLIQARGPACLTSPLPFSAAACGLNVPMHKDSIWHRLAGRAQRHHADPHSAPFTGSCCRARPVHLALGAATPDVA